jgi:hypothetical protein
VYRRERRDQLSFKDFFLPFGVQLSGENPWIKLAELIPWDELEDDYESKFCKRFGAPAKPFRMVLGALIIKARLGLTDEEMVEQIKENPYLQFFIGLDGYQYSAPFDPSTMVDFRKRLPESVVNDCNERIVRYGLKVGLPRFRGQVDRRHAMTLRLSFDDHHDHVPSPVDGAAKG